MWGIFAYTHYFLLTEIARAPHRLFMAGYGQTYGSQCVKFHFLPEDGVQV